METASRLHQGVLWLFRRLLRTPLRSRIYINTTDQSGMLAQNFRDMNMTVSCVQREPSPWAAYERAKEYNDTSRIEAVACQQPTDISFKSPQFHYAFSFPLEIGAVHANGTTVDAEDTMVQYDLTKQDPRRYGPEHLMLMDQAKTSLLPAGFYGAVLSRKWAGKYTRFLNQWSERMGMVVRIRLPKDAIRLNDGEQGDFSLMIFHKTYQSEGVRSNDMAYATLRHPCFSSTLKSMQDEDLEMLAERFKKHAWWRYSAKPYSDMIGNTYGGVYAATSSDPTPIQVPEPDKILRVATEKRIQFAVVDSIERIKSDPNGVRVLPKSKGVKLVCYNASAECKLTNVHYQSGYDAFELRDAEQAGVPARTKFDQIMDRPLYDGRDHLLRHLVQGGLTPYMIDTEYNKMLKGERRLAIQMTPFERVIQVPSEDDGDPIWERIYDDVSVRASFPEVFNEWEHRARTMKMDAKGEDSILYPFQFMNEIFMACKDRVMLADHMGLGKSRQSLFHFILRTARRVLIVCPVRLVGVWQTEIETTIDNYCRRQVRDWSGKPLRADYQIIQYARDCLPENLATFNIVSYTTLASVPKDSVFFVCPTCKERVCSHFAQYRAESQEQACPRCNKGRVQEAKLRDKQAGRRKYRLKGGIIQDDRVSSGNPVMMERSEVQLPKLKHEQFGTTEYFDPGLGQMVQVPNIVSTVKTMHLKWTFAEILRNLFPHRLIDEANNVQNAESMRSTANEHCRAAQRVSLTGTPITGKPQSVVNLMNWTHTNAAYPNYRPVRGNSRPGIRDFEKRFVTMVKREGQSDKPIPKIRQPEIFQQEIAPLMLRNTRYQPDVAASIPPRRPDYQFPKVNMDTQHRKFYQKWLEAFAEWWQAKRKEVDKKLDAKVANDLLVKLGYLINASAIPHYMSENWGSDEGKNWAKIIGVYEGPPVAKMVHCMELLKKYKAMGDKTIIGTSRVANVDLGNAMCVQHSRQNPTDKIYSLKVTGMLSNAIDPATNRSPKQTAIDNFCNKDYHALWATTETLKEGFNIWQANHAILVDYQWNPQPTDQLIGRMLRPQQTKACTADFLVHRGTVDEYMAALVYLKSRSIAEGIDFESFDDFNYNMIPDFAQYADAIVDGTTQVVVTKMWSEVEELKRRIAESEGK